MILSENKLNVICETLVQDHPNKSLDYYLMFLSTETLRILINNDWVNEVIFKDHHKTSRIYRDAFTFLHSDNCGFKWQTRVLGLAERVYNLQKIVNFDLIIKDIITGQLVSRYAEIEVGSQLMSRGIPFEFNLPTGVKGSDYDISILLKNRINCEVKHKIESTVFSENTLKNTISGANKQLPKNEYSIIFIKIFVDWIYNKDFEFQVTKVFEQFFQRNKKNNIGIVLRWEEQSLLNPGVFLWNYKVFKNVYHSSTEEITNFLDTINSNRENVYWTSFREKLMNYVL